MNTESLPAYNPFTRGPAPVGVCTIEIHDNERGVTLPVEIWYPATERYRGQDLDPATNDRFSSAPGVPDASQQAVRDAAPADGRFPLLMHNHGAYGYRQVNSKLCTHLASHGYVVASNDVPGNTLSDLVNDVHASRSGKPTTSFGRADVFVNRWAYASFVIERVIAGAEPEIAARIEGPRVGAFGQSAGGWTTLGLNQINPRMGASFAMEPLWGRRSPLGLEEMGKWLRLADWGRQVPTFLLAGELDTLIILQDLRELYDALPAPKRFASLRGAGHWHMCDDAEFAHETFREWYLTDFPDRSFGGQDAWRALGIAMRPFAELCPADHALDTMRGLCLAHMDTHLKNHEGGARVPRRQSGGRVRGARNWSGRDQSHGSRSHDGSPVNVGPRLRFHDLLRDAGPAEDHSSAATRRLGVLGDSSGLGCRVRHWGGAPTDGRGMTARTPLERPASRKMLAHPIQ